jgi:16S rRNA processing protein RimM
MLHVEHARPFKEGLLVTFQEIADRNEADLWRERYLLVPVEELEPLGDLEVYLHDLPGLRVERADGTVLGVVEGFFELPHGLLLEVRRANDTVLMPYREEFVVAVDVPAGILVVDPPDGLFA